MPPAPPTTAAAGPVDRPVAAILALLLASLVFTGMDGFVKALAVTLPPSQIILARYGFAAAVLLPVLWRYRTDRLLVTTMPVRHAARGLCLFASATLFTFALQSLPLETATAIGFVAPLYVTALSIVFLGEQVGIRRWSAVVVGFAGVVVIVAICYWIYQQAAKAYADE